MSHPALRRVVCLAALLATIAACGKKGDPQPPILLIPAPTTDLAVVQRGDKLLLDFAYPQTTAAGTALPGLAELAVWQLVWQAPAGTAEPLEADEMRFLAGARPVRVLAEEELAAVVEGDRVRLTLDVPPPEGEIVGVPAVTLAVKTEGPGGRESAFSNRVTVPPIDVPVPPTEIAAEGQGRGIRLRWDHPDVAGSGEDEDEGDPAETDEEDTAAESPEEGAPPAAEEEDVAEAEAEEAEADEETPDAQDTDQPGLDGFNVYRRLATERTYGAPLRTLGRRARAFLDESALFGQSYIYTVTAVASRRPVVVESDFAEEVEVVYRDIYPPPVPQELVALTEGSRVRLVWEASAAPDLAGYRVYRRGPDTQEFRAVTDVPVTGTDFTDRDLPAGATYTYQVTAVDRLGNESRPSRTATAAIR